MRHIPTILAYVIMLVCFVPIADGAQSANSRVDPEVRAALQSRKTTRVMVHLDQPIKMRGKLTLNEKLMQAAANREAQKSLLSELGNIPYRVVRQYDIVPALSMEIEATTLAVLERSPRVLKISAPRQLRPLLSASVPYTGANQAWSSGFDGTGWYVAIIDSGVDKNHDHLKVSGTTIVDLEACFSISADCPNSTEAETGPGTGVHCAFTGATDACSHGTAMAGIVASRDGTLKGVAPGARLISIRTASPNSSCSNPPSPDTICLTFDTDDILSGLQYVYSLSSTYSIAAVNMSLGGDTYYTDQAACDALIPGIKEAIDNLRDDGIATVIASGNKAAQTTGIDWPGCISSAVNVGATNNSNQIWANSVSGSYLSLLAPGVSVTAASPGGSQTATGSGTSNAAAHVSGAWAIMKDKEPGATVGQILNALQTTGVKITDTRTGANNRVNCRIQIDDAVNNIPDSIVTLPVPEAVAYGINNCGQIVGTEYVNWTGFLADTMGTVQSIVYDGPIEAGGFYYLTETTAINNKGEVHGYYCCDYYGDGSYMWNPSGQDVPANYPNSYSTDVYGNNDAGDLVGNAATDSFWGGFKRFSGNFSEVTVGGPIDINNMRRMVGVYDDENGFLTDENGNLVATFQPTGSTWTYPMNINESGQIVGHYMDSGWNWHGFIRKPDGTITTVDIAGATDTGFLGINDSGQIVGYYVDSQGSYYGFVDLRW